MVQKILVSQPRPLAEHTPYREMEKQFGVHFDFRQMIHIEGLSASAFRLQRINPLDYTAVLLNSRQSADQYFRMMSELHLKVPASMHYYCISDTVANYLQKYIQYRKRKVFFAEHNKFSDLLETMQRKPEEKFMLVSSDIHNDEVVNLFAKENIVVTPVVFYRTVSTLWPKEVPFDYDMIVLFTPAGAQSLKANFPDLKDGDKVIACFGQNTAGVLRSLGFTPAIEAPSDKFPSITSAIYDYLERQK